MRFTADSKAASGQESKFAWFELGAQPPGGLMAECHPTFTVLLPEDGSHQRVSGQGKSGSRKTGPRAPAFLLPREGWRGRSLSRLPLHGQC